MRLSLICTLALAFTAFAGFAQNLIPNGNFSSTTASFDTDLDYVCPANTEGDYCISVFGWNNKPDHTNPGTGNLLNVDGFSFWDLEHLVWGKSINGLDTGSTYELSYWLRNRNSSTQAILEVLVDSIAMDTAYCTQSGEWQKFSLTFTKGSGSTTRIEFVSLKNDDYGDFDMDDIFLKSVYPAGITTSPSTYPDTRLGPNPADESLWLWVEGSESELHDVQLFDQSGRVVKNVNDLVPGQPFDVSNLAAGLYIYRVFKQSELVTTQKVLIK